jgi:linoleoyl-CoA desaturase
MGSLINLLGASGFNWKLQHNVLHHTYTNVDDMDDDIADKPMLRFSPYSPISKFHQYQWLYAFLFYGLTTLYWVVAKDFVQFNQYKKNGVNNNSKAQNRIVLSKIILLKTIYFSIILFVPIFIFHIPTLQVLSGFLWMHFISGIILTVIFQLAHTVEGTSYPLPDEKGIIEKNWAIHQMETTVNFSRKNRIISWYVGGLNFQVEHHLFPRISHIHYPEISEIVKSTAEEFNVPYLENETFWDAFRSHIAALKKMGSLPDLNEVLN